MAKKAAPIKKINLIPVANNMITTAYLVKTEANDIFTGASKPHFLPVQQVLAVGPRVEDVKVGDWVYLDYNRFVKHVKKKSEIKVGIGGQDMISEQFEPPGFVAPGDDGAYFKITDREIEGVIKNFAELPDYMREYITVETFEKNLASIQLEAAKAKQDFDRAKEASIEYKESIGPAVIAEGKVRS
jgi:hypothetical protein